MPPVKRTNPEIRERRGRVNRKKLASVSESDIERFARRDNCKTDDLGEPRYVPPPRPPAPPPQQQQS